jgi:hypothetical protein
MVIPKNSSTVFTTNTRRKRSLETLIPVLKRDDASKKRHAIAFYLAITNKLQRIFRNHLIDLVYSNKGKLKDSLGNPKDKTEMVQKSGIYQVECEGCDSVYRQNVA